MVLYTKYICNILITKFILENLFDTILLSLGYIKLSLSCSTPAKNASAFFLRF